MSKVVAALVVSCGLASAQPAEDPHRGFTFEANLGVGWLHESGNGYSHTMPATLAPLDVSIGGFLTNQLALVGRIAGTEGQDDGANFRYLNGFVGPAVQYWFTPQLWASGGLGLAIFGENGDSHYDSGLALDLRVGYTFFTWFRQSANVSVELIPARYATGDDLTGVNYIEHVTSFAILLGYQFL
ncbi:MAG: transporter [Kofleriaceae bacterium]